MPANRPNLRPPAGGLLIANPPAPRTPAPGLPLPRRPAPRHLLATLALAVLLIAGAVPAVSAEVILDEEMVEFEDTGGTISVSKSSNYGANSYVDKIYLKNIQDVTDLHYIIFTIDGYDGDAPSERIFPHKGEEGSWPVSFTLGGRAFDAMLYKTYQRNYLGTITATRYAIYFDEWDIGTLTGSQYLLFTDAFFWTTCDKNIPTPTNDLIWLDGTSNRKFMDYAYKITISCVKDWKNRLTVTNTPGGYDVVLQRQYGAMNYASRLTALKNDAIVYYQERATDFRSPFATSEIDTIKISSASTDYLWSLTSGGTDPTDPDNASVTVVVHRADTGAILPGATVVIKETSSGTELINETLPTGVGEFELPETPGYNPAHYSATASCPGYLPSAGTVYFQVPGPIVRISLQPESAGPADPNLTYLEFYVRDPAGNGISGANVNVGAGGYVRTTNSQGYTRFEVPKNATYTYEVGKYGGPELDWMTVSGSVTVADDPRYSVSVVLYPGMLPTYTPTLGPGETPGGPGATPTPDTRTNEQKGQAIIDLIADFAEPIAILAILATIFGLMKMMTPGRR